MVVADFRYKIAAIIFCEHGTEPGICPTRPEQRFGLRRRNRRVAHVFGRADVGAVVCRVVAGFLRSGLEYPCLLILLLILINFPEQLVPFPVDYFPRLLLDITLGQLIYHNSVRLQVIYASLESHCETCSSCEHFLLFVLLRA